MSTMSDVKSIFANLLELQSEEERAVYLNQACGENQAVRAEVERLTRALNTAGHFMSQPAARTVTLFEISGTIGDLIGPYKLMQKLGEGGMGTVFLAEQEHPVKRRVALKVIKIGMGSQQILARFEQERQALAMMDHPNIARVIDAGQSEAGSPFIVMELVMGVPITLFCDQQRLTPKERLELFIPVCQAVQHAHQKGIIHRDLKPSNVLVALVDGQPVPKIIDFGVAKATAQTLSERTFFTEIGTLVGTLEYMAPEQAELNNLEIDTRADIYSLGVILYEILCGSTPFTSQQLRDAGFAEMLRLIREVEPPKPSTKLSSSDELPGIAATRKFEPKSLTRLVTGELDWIVMKCLEKDRGRRYGAANDLAMDLQRYLNDELVLAGPPSAGYMLRKYARKHRVALSVATAFGLILIAATVVSSWQAVRASRASAEARKRQGEAENINEFMYDALTSVVPGKKGADLLVVEVLDDASKAASQHFAGNAEQEGKVRQMLGDIYRKLGMVKEAPPEYLRAVELLQTVLKPDDRRLLVVQVEHAASLLNTGSHGPASNIMEKLLPRLHATLDSNDSILFDAERLNAGIHYYQGRYKQAAKELRQLRQRADSLDSDDRVHIGLLDGLLMALGPASIANRAVLDEMDELARELVERSERTVGAEGVQSVRSKAIAADIMVRRGEFQQAADICGRILAMSEKRLGKNHSQRLKAMDVLADAKHRLGDSTSAADLVLLKLEGSRQYDNSIIRVARISGALPILDRGGRWAEGEALAREYSTELVKMGGGHGSMQFNADLQVGRFVSLQGRADEANTMFESLARRLTEVSDDRSAAARLHLFKGSLLRMQGDHDGAEKELQAAADTLPEGQFGTSDVNPDDLALEFVALYEAWGKSEKVGEYRKSLEKLRSALACGENSTRN